MKQLTSVKVCRNSSTSFTIDKHRFQKKTFTKSPIKSSFYEIFKMILGTLKVVVIINDGFLNLFQVELVRIMCNYWILLIC